MITGRLLYWRREKKYDVLYKVVHLSEKEVKLIQKVRRKPQLVKMILNDL